MNKYLLLIPFFLTACGGDVKENLGLRKQSPDEFAVERRPALDIPPEFKIRPPSDELETRQTETRQDAKELLFGNADVAVEAGEGFMNKIGVANADPSIRETLIEEYGVEDPDFLDRVRSISDDNINKTVVDAKKERERIAENIEQGKSAAEGETISKPRSNASSVIDKLLGD